MHPLSDHLLIVFVLLCHAWKISLFTRISFAKNISVFNLYTLLFTFEKYSNKFRNASQILFGHIIAVNYEIHTKTSNVFQCVLVKHEKIGPKNYPYTLSKLCTTL